MDKPKDKLSRREFLGSTAAAVAAPNLVDLIGSELTRYHIAKSQQVEHESLIESKRAAESSLAEFIHQGWHVLEPATAYVQSWHVEAMCEHAEAVSRGQINRLVVNVPPGFQKSLTWSVFWPAWDWLNKPWRRFLTASYGRDIAIRDAVKSRRLITSNWFQERWSDVFTFAWDQNQKSRYENDQTGFRIATSVGSGTGERAHIGLLDDPHNIDDAESDIIREGTIDWIKGTWSCRGSTPEAPEVLIMQRLHQRDASGYYLAEVGGYEHLMLPMKLDPKRRCFIQSTGFSDPRTEPGELLCPQRFNAAAVEESESKLGVYKASGQLQQQPTPPGGGIIKRHWFRYWQPKGANLPPVKVEQPDGTFKDYPAVELPDFNVMIQSWDMTFKDLQASSDGKVDFVVGQAWGLKGADMFLINQRRGQWDFVQTCEQLKAMTAEYPKAIAKIIEAAANGPAVVSALQHFVNGLIATPPDGGKIARMHAASPVVQSGNTYIPHPHVAWWIDAFIDRTCMFPHADYDDEQDAMTQAIKRLSGAWSWA